MLTKLYLILRPVKVEKEDKDETWGDIWDMGQLTSDVEYTGFMTLGPFFNPRPENVEVINIIVPMEHERISETERTDRTTYRNGTKSQGTIPTTPFR